MTDKKKVEDKVSDKNKLDLAMKSIVKKYGEVVSTLGEHRNINMRTISTGCLSLDLALGRGGMGLGRIYEVFGPNSSGKSTLAVNVAIQAQRRNLQACYVDAEHAVDPELFKNYGVDLDRLQLVQGYDGEQNLDILERLLKTGVFSVAVVDSVSSLIPRAEAEAGIEKQRMGDQAKLMSKALRKIGPIASQTNTLLIFVNQIRMKLDGYGNPETTSGGEALPFYATGRILVRGPEAKSRRIADPVTGEVIGHKTLFEVVKNKLASPFKKANVNLIYGKGYDAYWEVLDLAGEIGVVDKKGSWYSYEGERLGQGELNVVEELKKPENSEIYNKIREEIIDKINLREQYESHSNPGPLYT
jgi:recombination protein RecA